MAYPDRGGHHDRHERHDRFDRNDRGDRGERGERGERGDRRGGPRGAGGRGRGRRFADLKIHEIDYRNERLLRKFVSERGKILPRRLTGVSALFQRRVTRAVKRARHLAILPFVAETYK